MKLSPFSLNLLLALKKWSFILFLLVTGFPTLQAQHSLARQWNEVLLEAIRNDFARPTVHARNLFHVSVAMYDAWAAYDSVAAPYFLGNNLGGFEVPFEGVGLPEGSGSVKDAERFRFSPGFEETFLLAFELFEQQGYDITHLSTDYTDGNPASLGNYIAQNILDFGLQDGSNEQFNYANLYYRPVNPPMVIFNPGNPRIDNPNRWQPLTLELFIDQAGNLVPGNTPQFLSPEWGEVVPFALTENELTIHERDGNEWWVYHDPGTPPYQQLGLPALSEDYKWGFSLVAIWSAHLAPDDSVMWDISPAAIGNVPELPQSFEEMQDFYDLLEGGDPSLGHAVNPHTGEPYEPQVVPRGDYASVLAEFWADGPDSETPPGHWYNILNYVNDNPLLEKRFNGQGPILDDLEWDVKAYFTLGGAMHDAAIAAWGVKGYYDYIRPVSAIRYLADLGQSSDPSLLSYNLNGIPLVEGFIELVDEDDPLAGEQMQHLGKIKLFAWRGPDYIENPETDEAGVGWILAENWWPYQRPSFVTPPFAGYVSGHSTYSRAAAEVLTLLTGDPFFPGGMGEFDAPQNSFLVFEEGPSREVVLQWATYRDASDQCSLSRIWGGIHPPADDIPGRLMGEKMGIAAFNYAKNYFEPQLQTVSQIPTLATPLHSRIFPNPQRNPQALFVELNLPNAQNLKIRLVSLHGQEVQTATRFGLPEKQTLELPLPTLSPGIYTLEVSGETWREHHSLQVQ